MFFLTTVNQRFDTTLRFALSVVICGAAEILICADAHGGVYFPAGEADALFGAMTTTAELAGGTDRDPAADSITDQLLYADSTLNSFVCCPGDAATYSFDWPGGDVYAWGRFYYPGSAPNEANSFFISVNGGPREIFGNHRDHFQTWHWDGDGSVPDGLEGPLRPIYLGSVPAGPLSLRIEKREVLPVGDQPRLDVVYLAQNAGDVPTDLAAIAALTLPSGEPPPPPPPGCTSNADCGSCSVCDLVTGSCQPVSAAGDLYVVAASHAGAQFSGDMRRASELNAIPAGTLTGDAILAATTTNGFAGDSDDVARYDVSLPSGGAWYLWGRLRYPSPAPNGANSFYVQLGQGPQQVLGNNKDFLEAGWHYDGDGTVPTGEHGAPQPLLLGTGFTAGPTTLTVTKREAFPVAPQLELLYLTQVASRVPTDASVDAALSETTCGEIECGNDILEPGEECDPPDGLTCAINCQIVCTSQSEVCDGLDNDCDDLVDEDFALGLPCSSGGGACASTGVTVCALDGLATVCDASPVSPGPESCNGEDDDCDGEVDEDFDVGDGCTVGAGACRATGVRICDAGGSGTACSASASDPQAETCNGMDDDCDGQVDESFELGVACIAGDGQCQRAGVTVCSSDGASTTCSADSAAPSAELCNGSDDDCDGEIDENYQLGAACVVGAGACEAAGIQVCLADGTGTMCDATPGAAGVETCNGLDDDCDGQNDESYAVGTSCSMGQGLCERQGVEVCTPDGTGTQCDAVAGSPQVEICGNGIDEDCDGSDLPCGGGCDAAPRLHIPDTICVVGQTCTATVDLEAGATGASIVAARLETPDGLIVGEMTAGACAAGAEVFTQATQTFAVTDLGGSTFCDGPVLDIELSCAQPGEYSMGLSSPLLTDSAGEPIDEVCAAAGTVTCTGDTVVGECPVPPRLGIADTDCMVGDSCVIPISLESDGSAVSSASGSLTAPVALSVLDFTVGSCADGASLFTDGLSSFAVSDFQGAAFCDGPIALAEVVCDGPGSYDMVLEDVSLASASGAELDACGSGATITCKEPLPEPCLDAPRLQVQGSDCAVGAACEVAVLLDSGDEDISSLAAALTVAGDLTVAGMTVGACATNGVLFESGNEFFSIVDFGNDPFCDGEVLEVEVTCQTDGTFNLGLSGTALGNTSGLPVSGVCGAGAQIVCGTGSAQCGNGLIEAGEQCDPPDGLTCNSACVVTCTPQTETCDGLDNDCDGTVDETFSLGTFCSAGIGECERTGTLVCTASGTGTECSASPVLPVAEQCNGLDDDCDGAIDEAFALGTPCTVGQGTCERSGVQVCGLTGNTTQCDVAAGTPAVEQCNGLDDDCDGEVDENFALGAPCVAGQGECAQNGIIACRADGDGTACSVNGGVPDLELCNGLDDDCDGQVDEDYTLGICSVGLGACSRTGTAVCALDGTGTTCTATPGSPESEICGNQVDEDCDGADLPCVSACGTAPRLVVAGTVCDIGESCTVPLMLEPGSHQIPSLAAAFDVPTGLQIESVAPGACAGAGTLFDEALPVFALTDFSNEPFCEGSVVMASLSCESAGVFELGLTNVSLGDVLGQPVIGGCGASGQIACTSCGNGVVEAGEQCDAGAGNSDTAIDGCRNNCALAHCGDAVVDSGEACDPPDGFSCNASCQTICQPQSEICDGEDNDCDGNVDEGFALNATCMVGVGECRRQGALVCSPDGLSSQCDVSPGPPTAELCNGADDDCDGTTDEGFVLGQSCSVGVGVCQQNGVTVCTTDGASTICGASPFAASTELCNGLDDDCDGEVDEDFTLTVCSEGVGACARSALTVCAADGSAAQCNVIPGDPSAELCNEIDDDCDGATDEDFAIGASCTVGLGLCERDGSRVCSDDGATSECDAVAGEPAGEICGNDIDEDCDGSDLPCSGGCDTAPRLAVESAACPVGGECTIAIHLGAGSNAVGQLAGAVEPPAGIEISSLTLGECAAEAILLDQGMPAFVVSGVGGEPFCDGAVVLATADCDQAGDFEIGLRGVAFSTVAGQPVDGACGASGQLTCTVCGNGLREQGEECDAGPANSDTVADACREDCLLPRCGDGVVDADEECDPPDGQACNQVCEIACIPQAEICDDIDNDCDGEVDEGFTLGAGCQVGTGACSASGVTTCAPDGHSTVCDATAGTPSAEVCGNGIDEDCNGLDLACPASCESAPRLHLADSVCQVGQPCQLAITLDSGAASVASLSGTLDVPAGIALAGLGLGSCAAAGSLFDEAIPTFAVTDFGGTPFCDGQVVTADVACTTAGSFAIDVNSVSLGTTAGDDVSGACGQGGTLICTTDAVIAQCLQPPRLSIGDTTCIVGEPCDLPVVLEAGDNLVPSVGGRLLLPPSIALEDMSAGACASGATLFDEASPNFAITDFGSVPFCDGPVVVAHTTCAEPGAFEVDLENTSIGNTLGQALDSCGLGGTVSCQASCDQAPRLVAEPTTCVVGQSCTVAVALEPDELEIVSAGGVLALPDHLSLNGMSTGGCSVDADLIESGGSRFTLAAFGGDPLCAGQILLADVSCSQAGQFDLGLSGVALATSAGLPVAGACGTGTQILCTQDSLITECKAAPRLFIDDAACTIGEPCTIEVQLDSGDNLIPSLSASLNLPDELALGDATLASCSAGANLFDQALPSFAIADFAATPFCDGPVLSTDIACEEEGTFSVGIDDVSLGNTLGHQVPGACGAGATLSCSAPCEAAPRVRVESMQCPVGEVCQVPLMLESGGATVSSVVGTLKGDSQLSLGSIDTASCSSGADLFDHATPSFLVGDFSGQTFCDGAVLMSDIVCETHGTFELDVNGVVLAGPSGQFVPGACGTSGNIECTDLCSEAPRLTVDSVACQVGASCSVALDLDAGPHAISSLAGTLVTPAEVSLRALESGVCAQQATLFDQNLPAFALTDFGNAPFCDGTVIVADVDCDEVGTFAMGVETLSLGDQSGSEVAGSCSTVGVMTCNQGTP